MTSTASEPRQEPAYETRRAAGFCARRSRRAHVIFGNSRRDGRGALDTAARFVLSYVALSISRDLPWGTILINAIGSFLIGFFGTLTLSAGRYPMSENARLFVIIGICGGFTTFSSFSLQTFDLLRTGALARELFNSVGFIVLCICAVAVGYAAAAAINPDAVRIAQIEMEGDA